MISTLVFSKDRPAQLDCLLTSIGSYAAALEYDLTVLWDASDGGYEQGYARIRADHPRVRFRQQEGFRRDVWEFMRQAYTNGGPDGPVSFLCDDDVFYRPAAAPTRLPWSLRGGDYDYPFSLDGNVYRWQHVAALLEGLEFENPTELEARGDSCRGRLPFTTVHPCEPPCLTGVPLNRVSASSGMPHMGIEPAALNLRFLAGQRLRLMLPPDPRAHEDRVELRWES